MTEQLKEDIRNYVSLDDYLRRQNDKLKEYKDRKKYYEERIISTIGNRGIQDININLPGGSLQFVNRENNAPINIGYLTQILSQYFARDIIDPAEAERKAQHCLDFILTNREKRQSQYLKRNFNR